MVDEYREILIKQYAGERLYNTATASYISLDDLAEMVLRSRRFVVQEARTGVDITHEVLDRLL